MNRRLAAIAAAAVMIMTATACSGGDDSSASGGTSDAGGTATPSSPSQVVTQGLSVLSSGTALDTVVVTVDGQEDMNVTFGDFLKEYKYRLAGYQITDDTTEMYASVLQEEREYIINYLVNERIMYRKFEELGFALTDEDNAQIDADTAAGIEGIKASLRQRIKDTELLSEEELDKRTEEEYDKLMAECGLTYDDIRNWQKAIVVQEKLTEYVNTEYAYDPTSTDQQVEMLIESAKESYEKDPANYDAASMASLWIPEDSRNIKHILLKFDDEAMAEINTLREEGKNAEADALREEKLGEMSAKIDEVKGKVEAGDDFDLLMSTYSDDGDTTMSYIITPGTQLYMDGFAETAFAIPEIGGTEECVTDYGWHMIKYTEDAVVTEDELQAYKESLHKYMEEQYLSQNYGNAMKKWRTEYTFEIDRDILMLADETAEA
ncbi:MAG: peptidylprolyl isomerase [Oscillospiraceae bacterium]|nr:peptidylprolyl isomerase [Oscillospiraceae bacterium]